MGVQSRVWEVPISGISWIVFFFLDILDAVMCVVFGIADRLLEGNPATCCCCWETGGDGGAGISETLRSRKNFAREIILKIRGMGNTNRSFPTGKSNNRWSDCGCGQCVSWMSKANRDNGDLALNVVIRNQENGKSDEAENVIFIHGFLSSSSLWKECVFPNLSQHSRENYNLYAVDLLGFGNSPKPNDCHYTLDDHVDSIQRSVVDPLRLKSFHLVAHSMGCLIALALAARCPAYVKSIYLVAPPYFSSSTTDVSRQVLRKLSARAIWPPLLFVSAVMSWYEHIGRCVCFLVCRNHALWESMLKSLTRKSDLDFMITDLTRHTHHSAWHTMHNVICGGAKFTDGNLEIIIRNGVERIHVSVGMKDEVVPVECSFEMKKRFPEIVNLETIHNADHKGVICGREVDFTRHLETVWMGRRNEIQKID